jgi:hypothetical protein
MKYIFLVLALIYELSAGSLKTSIVSVDDKQELATIKIAKIDLGMSGFISHKVSPNHSSILKNAVVSEYNATTQIATLKLSEYNGLVNNALPSGNWKVVEGDTAIFAFGYNRALLIAPSEEIYHQVSKSVNIQWIHPDIFATILSFRGHPTPLKEDFKAMGIASSVGLVFIYLDQKVYMLDINSFTILSITKAPLVQDNLHLPFYSRIEEIDAAWWGEGSDELEEYEPHYYELLVRNNKNNKKLYDIIKNGDAKYHELLEEFEIGK